MALIHLGWASTWPVGKAALRFWTPIGLTAVRHAVAGTLLLGLAWSLGRRSRAVGWSELRVGLLQFCAYYVLTYLALETGTVYAAAAGAGVYPVFVTIILFLRTSPPAQRSARAWAGSGLALVGVGLLCADARSLSGSASLKGMALAVLASLAMAVAVLTPRPASVHRGLGDAADFVGKSMILGAMATCALALVSKDPWIRSCHGWQRPVTALAWLAVVGSALVFLGVEWVNKRYGPWKASLAYAAVPAMVAVMDVLFLGEKLHILSGFGLLVTVGGIAVAELPGGKRQKEDGEENGDASA